MKRTNLIQDILCFMALMMFVYLLIILSHSVAKLKHQVTYLIDHHNIVHAPNSCTMTIHEDL